MLHFKLKIRQNRFSAGCCPAVCEFTCICDPLGDLQRIPRSPSWIKGEQVEGEGKEEEKRMRKERDS